MNSNKLKAKMVENRINGQQLSAAIGISKSALYRKMNGNSEFTLSEIKKASVFLGLDNQAMLEIFFG